MISKTNQNNTGWARLQTGNFSIEASGENGRIICIVVALMIVCMGIAAIIKI